MKFQNILITVLIVASIHSTALSMEQKSQQKGKQSGKNPKKSQRKKTSEDDELKMLEAAQEQNLHALIQKIVTDLKTIRFALDCIAETYQHRVSKDGKIIIPLLFSQTNPHESEIFIPFKLEQELRNYPIQIGTTQATIDDIKKVVSTRYLNSLLQEEVSRRGKIFSSPQEEIQFVESKLPLEGIIKSGRVEYHETKINKKYSKEELNSLSKIVEEVISYQQELFDRYLPHFKYERFNATPTLVSFVLKWDRLKYNMADISMLFEEYKDARPGNEKQFFGIIMNSYASVAIINLVNKVNTDSKTALQYPSKLLRRYNDFLQKTDAAIKLILAMIEKQSASFIFDFLDYKPQSEETKKTTKSIDQALKMGTSILDQMAKKSIPVPEKKKPTQKIAPISAAGAGKEEEEEEPTVITEETTIPPRMYVEEEISQVRPRTMKVTLPSLAKITYAPRIEKWFDPEMLETANRSSLLYHRFPKEMDKYLLEYGASKVFRRVKGKPEMLHSLVGEINFDDGTQRYVQYHLTINNKNEIYHRGIEPRRLENIRKLDEPIKQRAEDDMPVLEYITAQPPQTANDMPDGVIEDNRFYVNIRDNTLGANFIAYKTAGFES